jgi:DNA invertase Pin-like site-specific DNA recombinase
MDDANPGQTPFGAAAPLAISYARVSSPEQAKRHGVKRQVERAVEYSGRKGLRYDESILDEGVSAFRGKHRTADGALKRFIDRVEAGEIPKGTYLLVESLDRLSREEVFDALTFFMRLIGLGLIIVTLGDGERVYSRESLRDDSMQLFGSLMVMFRAHEESATKSDRVGRAWAAKRERAVAAKQAMTARCPAWIRLVGGPRMGSYELVEERAAIVREMFEKTIGGVGRRIIARSLNAEGVLAWGLSRTWHDSYVQKIISNPAVYGAFAPLGKLAGGTDEAAELIEGYFPAVVDEETFRRAQAASKGRGSRRGRTDPTHRNLLRGLAKCEACGANMVFIDKGAEEGDRKRGLSLKCGNAHRSAGCKQSKPYPYTLLEVGLMFGLGRTRAELAANAVSVLRLAEDKLAAAVARRDEAIAKHEQLLDLRLNGVEITMKRMQDSSVTLSALKSVVADAEAALDRAKLTDPETDVASMTKMYGDLSRLTPKDRALARATMAEKLKRLVSKVVVGPDGYVVHHADGTTTRGVRMG